jgi:hypothetical protein
VAERWHVWARTDWRDGAHLTAGCDVNAGEGGIGIEEAVEYGLEVLDKLGGVDSVDTPGDTLTITVKLVDV